MNTPPEVTCGVADHDDDCLCDVVIKEPVPVRYAFHEVHLADIVAKHTRYRDGAGGAPLAAFLEAFSDAIEATARMRDFDPDWLDGALRSDLSDRIHAHLAQGESIVDAPDMLGESFARIVAVLTRGQPSTVWTWDERRWVEFEERMTAPGAVAACDIEREFGVTRHFVGRMAQVFYGTQLLSDEKARRNHRMRELFELGCLSNQRIVDTLQAEGWVDVRYETVKKMRQRWRKQITQHLPAAGY